MESVLKYEGYFTAENHLTGQPFVIIIILNLNKINDLVECIESIYRMDYKNLEIIVVDNGSTDNSVDVIKKDFPEVHLIENKNNAGVAGGRNTGLEYANSTLKYDYVFFLDNDVILAEKTLSEMVDSFSEDKTIGIVTPKCYSALNPGIFCYAGGINVNLYTGTINNIGYGKKDIGQYDKMKSVPSCGGLCLIRRSLIDKIGLFDENFNPYGWEDVDFSLRTHKSDFKISFNYKAVIYHKGGKIGRGMKTREYEYSKVRNYFYLLRKHANIFQLFVITLLLPFRVIYHIVRGLFKSDYKIIFVQFTGLVNFLKVYWKQNNGFK